MKVERPLLIAKSVVVESQLDSAMVHRPSQSLLDPARPARPTFSNLNPKIHDQFLKTPQGREQAFPYPVFSLVRPYHGNNAKSGCNGSQCV
jgi:hypothetical protein